MKKIIALILSIVLMLGLAVTFTACEDKGIENADKKDFGQTDTKKNGGNDDKNPADMLIGKWQCELEFEKIVEAMGNDSFDDDVYELFEYCDLTDLPLTLVMEFSGKTVRTYFQEDKADEFFDEFCDRMFDGAIPYTIDLLKKEGVTLTEDELFEYLGMTRDEYKKSMLENMNKDEALPELCEGSEEKYRLEGERLHFYTEKSDDDEYFEVDLTSKELTLKRQIGTVEGYEEFGKLLPMTFIKMK